MSHLSKVQVIELDNYVFIKSSNLENYIRVCDIRLYFPELEQFLTCGYTKSYTDPLKQNKMILTTGDVQSLCVVFRKVVEVLRLIL